MKQVERRSRCACWAVCAALLLSLAWSSAAEAYPTRVHIMLSNKIRDALVASGDGTIQLRGSPHTVKLPMQDADAIVDFPLAFRAGAVGPDNLLFPGMTDATHGMHFHPFDQCEALYEDAFNGEERAYALGCFLHGSTDAVAHHFVNFFAGETFTLNPITSRRESSFSNVARHILIEGMIMDAAAAGEPGNFATGKMLHAIPRSFVMRNYFNDRSPLWAYMGTHQLEAFETETARQDPDALLVDVLRELQYAAIDHLIMLPVYLRDAERRLAHLETRVRRAISDYQDPRTERGALLRVGPGRDGVVGTEDDTTGCSVTCPEDYARYFVYMGLVAPRFDAMGRELPSAYDKIEGETVDRLYEFLPILLQTIESLSGALNGPLNVDGSQGIDLDNQQVQRLLAPLDDWVERTSDIDHGAVAYAVVPDWILSITRALDSVGLSIDVPDVLNLLFGPIVHQITEAITDFVIEGARFFIEELLDFVLTRKAIITDEYEERLWASAPPDAPGHALTDYYNSGLFIHSFNFAAAAFANHALVLPQGQGEIGHGPTSFDASYTLDWSQAGLCEHLRVPIFPLGMNVQGLLSLSIDGQARAATMIENAPVECHDGDLDLFGAPSAQSCEIVSLDDLIADPDHRGSISRAFPPTFDPSPPACRDLVVDGLPEPDCGDDCEEPGCQIDGDCAQGQRCLQGQCVRQDGPDPQPEPEPTPEAAEPDDNNGFTNNDGFTAAPAAADEGCQAASGGSLARGPRAFGPLALLLLALGPLALGLLALRRGRAATAPRAARKALALIAAALAIVAGLGCGDAEGPEPLIGPGVDGGAEPEPDPFDMRDAGTPDAMNQPEPEPVAEPEPEPVAEPEPEPEPEAPDLARELRRKLYGTIWHGEQERDEGGRARNRGFELIFDDASLWAEIRNPFGPARQRVLRSYVIEADGATVNSVVQFPEGWERPPRPGAMETWTVVVEEGNPRRLRISGQEGTEVFTEGPWPAPDRGLTAQVRTFGSGVIEDAFCTSGVSGFEHRIFWEFARGQSDTPPRNFDVVAGASLSPWTDPSDQNRFAVTDVDGFDQLGGTLLSDQRNFVVLYTGTVDHPGGELGFREQDDGVEDAVWVFVGDKVGSTLEVDMFLEVHGFFWPDGTDDEPEIILPAGPVDVEVIIPRCSKQIADVNVEIRMGSGDWIAIEDAPTHPDILESLFPDAL